MINIKQLRLIWLLLLLGCPVWVFAAVDVGAQLGHTSEVISVAFSRDGEKVVSCSKDMTLKLWDVATGREIRTLRGLTNAAYSVAFSPNGKMVVSGNRDGLVQLWDVVTGREMLSLKGHTKDVLSVAFSQDDKTIVSGGRDGDIKLWDVAKGAEIRAWHGHDRWVRTVAFSPDGKTLLSSSYDNMLKLWDVAGGLESRTLGDNEAPVEIAAFSPDGKAVVSLDSIGAIKLWNVAGKAKPKDLRSDGDWASVIAISSSSKMVAFNTADNTLKLRSVAGSDEPKILRGHGGWVSAVAFSPDDRMLVSGSNDNTLKLWDVATGREIRTLRGYGSSVESVAFSPDGKTIASASVNNTIKLWDVHAGVALRTLTEHGGLAIAGNSFSPDGKTVAVESKKMNFITYTFPSDFAVSALRGVTASGGIPELTVSDEKKTRVVRFDYRVDENFNYKVDGTPLLVRIAGRPELEKLVDVYDTTKGANTLAFFDAFTGQVSKTLSMDAGFSSFVGFSLDSKAVITSSEDEKLKVSSLKIWDVNTGKELHTLKGKRLKNFGFSPNGNMLIESSGDSLKLRDVATGRELHTLSGHGGSVTSATFSPEGNTIISASNDKSIRVWRVSDGAHLASFIDLGEKGWVVITPEGFFNASSYEAADTINVVQGMKVWGIAEFWDVFYRPDLVRKKLAGENIAKDIGGITFETALKSPPPRDIRVKVVGLSPETQSRIKVAFHVPDAGGGIGEVRVFHNGKLVASDGMFKDAVGKGSVKSVLVQLKRKRLCKPISEEKACAGEISLEATPGEENEVSVITFNDQNTIQSLPGKVSFKNTLAKREPHLWIFPVGINEFLKGQSHQYIDLSNAAKDAQDFARNYAEKAKTLFKPEHIHVVGTKDGGPLLDRAATRSEILARLDEVAKQARPEDTFVWFVSSHGTADVNGIFGIVPHDIRLITSNDILEKSKAIKAMNQLFILDTCQSGALDAKVSGLYDARMVTLAKNMGLHLYAAAQATESASDSDGNGNGLFTGQLLAGLASTEADIDKNQIISIVELGDFAKRKTIGLIGDRDSLGRGNTDSTGKFIYRSQTPLIWNFGRDAGLVRVVGAAR